MYRLVKESTHLPFTNGTINIDSSNGPITIVMTSGQPGDLLVIRKISEDDNPISLYSEDTFVNGSEITLFGIPEKHENVSWPGPWPNSFTSFTTKNPFYSKSKFTKAGSVRVLILKSLNGNWKSVYEE